MIGSLELRRLAVGGLMVLLAGATAFGVWHLVVGGLINGNPRAGTFGVVLAVVAGSLLGLVAALRHRLRAG